ncbi:Type VI secretion, VasB, ImpH, VC_A0111 [Pedobacter westerhofensis]|uniref:Type VI secretion, VasB, ImpH, VC_A0111 n=1 Tax=Pedobacter westerhofensis TaxID=425512 RepID=A0A521BFV3_9SPHI|nr:type VI secretion system baseplate subunit TssG [Pedobacter westerhofensis]SMO45973.1 Type VI secretion, VasB, ImpH, VC_A0111 [Pedobacter westerhofensis]
MKPSLNLRNNLDTDYKVITKAAELIESGDFEDDQIVVLPVGGRKSAFAKDLENHSFYYSDSKRKDCLVIELNREGLYDMLPEGLFHQPPTGSSGFSEQEMIEDVQIRRAEEKDARKFFMPFEAELNHLRTILELYENKLDKRTTYNDLTRIFGAEWKEFELLDNEQSIIWMHLLPLISEKRNNLEFLGQLLSSLFKLNVKAALNDANLKRVPIAESMQFVLGAGSLGIDAVIGNSFLTDEEEVIISIGPADTDKLVRFMPGTPAACIIDLAVSYLIPVGNEVSIRLVADTANQLGSLGAESNNSFLGFTVYL